MAIHPKTKEVLEHKNRKLLNLLSVFFTVEVCMSRISILTRFLEHTLPAANASTGSSLPALMTTRNNFIPFTLAHPDFATNGIIFHQNIVRDLMQKQKTNS